MSNMEAFNKIMSEVGKQLSEETITAIKAALEAKDEPVAIDGNTSDGYHTFNELYEFRKAYNVALFNEWASNGKCSVHKSWRHNDGELCFGGGWFIVVAVLPQGQISNHYEAKDWGLFSVLETERALFEFDGHTGSDVVERLKSYAPPRQEAKDEPVAWKYDVTYNQDGTVSVALPDGDELRIVLPNQQEPYCWTWDVWVSGGKWRAEYGWEKPTEKVVNLQPLYTTPPQRTWVGLTNDEVNDFAAGCHLGNSVQGAIYKAEAKLKEKNNG